LYDTAEAIRFEMLSSSSYEPLAQVARKFRGELRYQTLHAKTWITQLGTATDESKSRLQKSLNEAMPFALGLFENSPYEKELIELGVFVGVEELKKRWLLKIEETLSKTDLILPDWKILKPNEGGRVGNHSEHLQPLLDEMSEVFRLEPGAEW
ncbi:MAG: phenylacetate-CoA oxygenase subunit PaaI, partial [Cyclobacteriaceae bacterium]|nr:phenylacetate-CoA oxygenase subunit PaaI [Cyclobacteriaceae bacterium]